MSPGQPPGWYADANLPGFERWWDGGAWSQVTRPVAVAQPPIAPPQAYPTRPPDATAPAWGTPYPAQQSDGYAYGPPRGVTPDGRPLAGQWWRLLARIIDGVILFVVASAIGWSQLHEALIAMADYFETLPKGAALPSDFTQQMLGNQEIMGPLGRYTLIYWLISTLYYVLLIRLRGATVGKLMVGLRVRPLAADQLPSWGQAVLRWATTDLPQLIPTVGPLYGLIDALWCAWDGKRQCLHDKLPKTVVIRTRDRPTL